MKKSLFVFLFFLLIQSLSFAAQDTYFGHQTDQQQIDDLYRACTVSRSRDKLCQAIITLKQIGDDSIEIVKEYMNLDPATYAALTLLNAVANGRFRFKTESFMNKKAQHIYDFRKDSFLFSYEQTF